jgi:excisionase family DNA binding protein
MTSRVIDEPDGQPTAWPADDHLPRAAYTVLEAAALLGLSPGSTYSLVRAGVIPARRVGGRWIVPKRRFHRWLDERTTR